MRRVSCCWRVLTWERLGEEEEDPEGSHSQNVRGELGWGVTGLFIFVLGKRWGGGGGADAFLPLPGVFFRKSSVYDPRTGWSKWEGMPPNCFAVVRG